MKSALSVVEITFMCRSIKQLRHSDAEPTEQEIYDAARQFVRKVSGYRVPSKRNQEIFDQTIQEIAQATRKMLENFSNEFPHASKSPISNLKSQISPKGVNHA